MKKALLGALFTHKLIKYQFIFLSFRHIEPHHQHKTDGKTKNSVQKNIISRFAPTKTNVML